MNPALNINKGDIARAAELISGASALIVAAGAGMGVDSGLPDFRGKEGFWKAYPALGDAGMEFYDIASPAAFESVPRQAWGFYGHRLDLYRKTIAHAGFQILKRWGDQMPLGYSVFTSNVDGQFQKAGFDPQHIYECHGSIHHLQCLRPCDDSIWNAEGFEPVVDESTCLLTNEPPRCPHCGAMARPNVLMFGDWGWINARSTQQSKRLDRWLDGINRPVIVEIGAGMAIPSVRHFSHRIVQQHGGRLLRINPDDARVPSTLDVGFATGALICLQTIDQHINRSIDSSCDGCSVSDVGLP